MYSHVGKASSYRTRCASQNDLNPNTEHSRCTPIATGPETSLTSLLADRRRYRRLATEAGRMPPPAAPPATFGGRLPDARGPARSATTRGLARLPTLPSLRQHTREGPRPGNKSNGVSAPL